MNCSSLPVLGSAFVATALLLGVASCTSPSQHTSDGINAMSFNIRFNNPGDGEHAWPNRRNRVASVIRFHQADVAGLQEALYGQIRDLEQRLPGYAWVGVGRDDGERGGEFSPIFYRTERLELLDHNTFWLSETPDVPGSQSWDAALPRIVTWAHFRDRQTEQTFYHFNTHFDHRGEQARLESAQLITQRVGALAGDAPTVVTGDFNVTPDTAPYAHLADAFTDAYVAVDAPHGPPSTYLGFEVTGEPGRRIDYVFTTSNVAVQRFGTLTDQWRGDYPSDHLPVLAEVTLP
jgi:endonuclease/exonuclease/phosphatase family metal-dependent hydrolase